MRQLVEFLLRSGDIDARAGSGASSTEAMLEGARIHRRIQQQRGPSYCAEVTLSFTKEFPEFDLIVEGRADGVIPGEQEGRKGPSSQTGGGALRPSCPPIIEEIKGVYRDLDQLEEPVPVHLAQAKCYAAIYALQQEQEVMQVRMTYVQMKSEEVRTFDSAFTAEELGTWFDALLEEYRRWAEMDLRHKEARDASMHGLEFPFPYREGQRDMVVAVYQTIRQKKQLFVQAPTGVGKTMSAVFPAVRALGEGEGEKIFYLTAKTIARQVAEEAFSILRQAGLRCKTVTLTAKEKICPQEECICDPELCPRACGHYDRVNEALFELLTGGENFDRETILAHCEKRSICPHEFQLDLTLFADAVIGDYNYVFDPRAKLRRFFGEAGRGGDYIFLIDEAHNLVDRGREMFSAELCKEEFLENKKIIKGRDRRLERALDRCNRSFLQVKKACDGACRDIAEIGELILPLMELAGALENFLWGEDAKRREDQQSLVELYFRVSAFLSVYDLVDENYMIYGRTERGRFLIKLFCVDPSGNLQAALDAGRAAVFFSATLLPLPYYRSLFSTRDDDYGLVLPSPFPRGNRQIVVGTDVSSKYTRRGESEYTRMAAYVHSVTRAQAGNYLIFFPSYQMMEAVADIYEASFADIETAVLRQHSQMREREREDFLEAFRSGEKTETSRIGFCVMGGIFAEGIDLAGEKLIGAIVVGTGLPQIGDERELLRSFYDRQGRSGFDYAYRLPGMNKVLQAAGRVIRTDRDRGVILLLDERFSLRDYRELFPAEWSDRRQCRLEEVEELLRGFWQQED